MTAGAGSVIRTFVPALAAALAELRRSPGKSEAWSDAVLHALERERPQDHDRLRRRLGFALRLADLAGLEVRDQAVVVVGLFFHELAASVPAKPPAGPVRVWSEYLIRNDDWLGPCLVLSEALGSRSWQDADDAATVVAKIAVLFDVDTLERHERPLQVLQDLVAETETPAVARIVPLLWSEDGQELCDHHFRRQPYKVDISEVRRSLEVLWRVTPRPSADLPVAPMRLSGAGAATSTKRAQTGEPRPAPPAEAQPAGSDSFARRRQALRSSHGWGGLSGGEGLGHARTAEAVDNAALSPAASRPVVPPAADAEPLELWLPPTRSAPRPEQPNPSAAPVREEETMSIRSMPPAGSEPHGYRELIERLEELHQRFAQIQSIAMEGQSALTSVATRVEELAAWLADLDAMVNRWRGPEGADEKAA